MRKLIIIFISFMVTGIAAQNQMPEEYFIMAAENNPGLQAKYLAFEAALQKVPQVNTLPDPTFSFGYFISPVETRVGPQKAKFSLTQMFPWFGTLEAQGNAAARMAQAKYQEFLEARNKLFYQVAAAYYPLFELKQWKQIEQENLDILKSYKNMATSKFKNNQTPMTDVLRVEMMINDATTNLEILHKKQKPLLAAFNKLLNRNDSDAVVINNTLVAEYLPENYRKDSLLHSHPLLRALDEKVKASEAGEVAAQKQGLPRLGLGIDYTIVSKRDDVTLTDNGKDVVMPMVSVSIPIFGKKYRAAAKEQQLMQQSYSLQKQEVINALTSNYESAWFELQQQKDLMDLYAEQIQVSNQTLNLLYKDYSNSGKEFIEVLRLQQQVLKYEKMEATAAARYQTALAKLNYLTAKTY